MTIDRLYNINSTILVSTRYNFSWATSDIDKGIREDKNSVKFKEGGGYHQAGPHPRPK